MGLDEEVTSLAFSPALGVPSGLWLAFGTRVAFFSLESKSLVMRLADASQTHTLLTTLADESDVLNDIALSSTHLAYNADSGVVGVLELSSGVKSEMRTRHSSIAGALSFIPDRPTELISGGYDSQLIHFDYRQATVLSRFNLSESMKASESGSANISLSPPFVTSLAVSPSRVVAAGTADGRLWTGFGGQRIPQTVPQGKKKKRRYWEGLKDSDNSLSTTVAQGPVVGVQFAGDLIITCSLGGKVVALKQDQKDDGSVSLCELWAFDTVQVKKVNTLKVSVSSDICLNVVVGGIKPNGKGCFEHWVISNTVADETREGSSE